MNFESDFLEGFGVEPVESFDDSAEGEDEYGASLLSYDATDNYDEDF